MKRKIPIAVNHLFNSLDKLLIDLLKSLSIDDWEKQTYAPKWKVKDVATHLLDGNLRTLSMLRDGYYGHPSPKTESHHDIVNYLNELNSDWVKSTKRLSPRVLTDLLESSGREYTDYVTRLHPFEKAAFSVDWAGESESFNWMHVAREYTEKWHHQQQIRSAVGQDEILYAQKYYEPYLSTSIRALPYHYRNIQGEEGDVIMFRIYGSFEAKYFLKYDKNWQLSDDYFFKAKTEVVQIIIFLKRKPKLR